MNHEARCGGNALPHQNSCCGKSGDVRFFARRLRKSGRTFADAVDRNCFGGRARRGGAPTRVRWAARNVGIQKGRGSCCPGCRLPSRRKVRQAAVWPIVSGLSISGWRQAEIVPASRAASRFRRRQRRCGNAVVRAFLGVRQNRGCCRKRIGNEAGLHRRALEFSMRSSSFRAACSHCLQKPTASVSVPFVVRSGSPMCCAINSGSTSPGATVFGGVAGDVGGGADGVAQGLFRRNRRCQRGATVCRRKR